MSDRFGNIPIDPPKTPAVRKSGVKPPPPPPSPTGAEQVKTKRGPVRVWSSLIIGAIIFALYSCLGFLGVPYYLTDILPQRLYEKTGMVLQFGTVAFNPLTFRFKASETKIIDPEGVPLVSLKSLTTDMAPLSLLRMDMVCNSLTIAELDLNLTRKKDGSYDFQALLGEKKVSDPMAIMNFSDPPFFFSLNNISITDSSILFHDIPAGKSHRIENIQLRLPTFSNISFQADRYLSPQFSAIVNGSPVELTGQAFMGSSDEGLQATRLSCDVRDLDLPLYSGYIPYTLPFTVKNGKAAGKVELAFDPKAEKGHKLSIGFDLQITGIALNREDGLMTLAAEAARMSGKFMPVSRKFHLEHVALRGPTMNSYGQSLLRNISLLLEEDNSSGDTPPPALPVSYQVIADLFIVDNGAVHHFNNIRDQQPATVFKSVQLAVKNYTTETTGGVDRDGGTFRVSGEISRSPAYFSYQGTFSSPQSLTGTLTLVKTPAARLWDATVDEHPFSLEGTTDLKGQLTVVVNEGEESKLSYKLGEAEASILDFRLIDNEKIVLQAPLVRVSPLSYVDETFNFGTITIPNGAAHFQHAQLPESLNHFGSARFLLEEFNFSGSATISHPDKSDSDLVLTKLSLNADGLRAPEKRSDNFSFSANSVNGGKMEGTGNIKLDPFSLTTVTEFAGFSTSEVFPFFTRFPLLRNAEGELQGKGTFSLPEMNFSGQLQFHDGALKESDGKQYFWKQALFKDLRYSGKPFRLSISTVVVDAPRLDLWFSANGKNPVQGVADYFQNNLQDKNAKSSNDEKYLPVDIEEIIFTDGIVKIEDRRLTPVWTGEIAGVSGRILNIDSADPAKTTDFSLTGSLDDTPFSSRGQVDIFAPDSRGRMEFSLEGYPLASFHEQLSSVLDIDTSRGEFTLQHGSKWQGRQFSNSVQFSFTDVAPVSPNSASAIPLALITSQDDTFQLSFDYSGKTGGSGMMLLEEAVSQFQTLIVKGSVSPFLLTDEYSDLIGNEVIEFQPGEVVIAPSGQRVLNRYAELLSSHPHVGLQLSGGISTQIDKPAIQEQLETVEKKRVDGINQKLFQEWQEKRALYEKKIQEQQKNAEQSGNIVQLDISITDIGDFVPLSPEPVVVDDAMILDLVNKRFEILYQYFSSRLPLQEGRISFTPETSPDPAGEGSIPGMTIRLKMIEQ